MSSYSEGQVHQLVEKLEQADFTADDLTKLGQIKDLSGIRNVVRGFSEIVPIAHILERKRFDPAKFMGKGWTIDERVGQRSGSNLDAGKIIRKDYLKAGESFINGEERLKRIKANPADIQYDEQDFLALYEEKGQKTLRWLYDTQGITSLSFWGIILRIPLGDRRVLYLYRGGHGSWYWVFFWLDDDWYAGNPSAVLAS
ncbi:MAG: hypothetical protein AAB424_01890 [Patescibacteria group bacterium]